MRHFPYILLTGLLCLYLGVHNGDLAIFQKGDSQPVHIFPYPEEVFPDRDQQALREGIPFSSREELSRLLEDFLS